MSIEALPADIAETAPATRKPSTLGIVVRNPSVIIGAMIVAFLALAGLLAPVLGTIDPSEINPVFRNKKPGFERTIRADDGKIYAGANIENLSFPQGWCAEPTAISTMIMGGGRKIVEMAVIAEKLALCPPCGGCRQKIAEFAAPDVKVTLCTTDGKAKVMTVADLLPGVFTAAHMAKV